jgi:rhomboid family protein
MAIAAIELSCPHMFPIGDENDHAGVAFVTIALIVLNALAFLYEINRPQQAVQAFIFAWGVVPLEYTGGGDLPPYIPYPFWATLLTSMFLHGGWGHLGGNMLFLWIFGDNVEHRVGHVRFLAFYLVCGVAAGLAHIVFNSGSIVPTVGASGAISGVLGGYLVMFPRNRVYVMTYGGVATVPAIMMLGLWIVLQFINGFGSVADTPETGGVAYLAHIGGFVAGMILAPLMAMMSGRSPIPVRPRR